MATAKFGLMNTYLTLVAMPTIQRHKFPDASSSNWCKGACQKSDTENLVQSFAGQGFQVKFDSLKLPERQRTPELSERYENLGEEWEYAAKLERSFASVDISIMAHQGIDRFPVYKRTMTGNQSFTFNEISAQRLAYGGDISFTLGEIVLRGEGIIKEHKTFMIASHSPLFQNDKDGLVFATEWEYLVGLDYNIFWDIFISAQYFERADNSAFAGLIRNQGNRLVSTLARRSFFTEDLLLEYRTLNDIQDKSSVHFPAAKYRFTDYLTCSVQGQIFIGNDNTTFGDYSTNSGALSTLELEF
jgi:hypothetical protein